MADKTRLIIENDGLDEACEVLDDAFIGYDIDSGDRILLDQDDLDEACEALDDAGIEYSEI